MAPASSSIMVEIAEPLWPPKGSSAPSSAAAGDVVGAPAESIAHPSGRGVPARLCSSTSPRAATLVAKSNTYGSPPGRGQPKANGFVPNSASVPPAGATVA